MSEQEIHATLEAYAPKAAPEGLVERALSTARRRTVRRRWSRSLTAVAATLVVSFAAVTFAPHLAVAAPLRQITPTLFLVTNLAEARQVMRDPLTLPAEVSTYPGEKLVLDGATDALVGRWGGWETVGVKVYEPMPSGGDIIHFDLRRTTYKPTDAEEQEMRKNADEVRPVKVGEFDGYVVVQSGHAVKLFWSTDKHWYRLLIGGQSEQELIEIARQIH